MITKNTFDSDKNIIKIIILHYLHEHSSVKIILLYV